LCMCSPAGQDDYFTQVGDPVNGRTAPPPELNDDEVTERRRRARTLAARFRTEMLT